MSALLACGAGLRVVAGAALLVAGCADPGAFLAQKKLQHAQPHNQASVVRCTPQPPGLRPTSSPAPPCCPRCLCSCMFVDKALALQVAGAVAMVVVNSEAGELMAMGTDAQGTQTAIPAVMLSGADGGMLLQELLGSGGGGSSGSGKEGSSSSSSSGGGGGKGSSQDSSSGVSSGTDGSSRIRLRLYADALPGGPDSGEQQCGAGTAEADKAGPRRQQVELLMSQEAQTWLFKKVAETSADPSAAFALILQQIQEHFLQQALRNEP